MEATTAPLEGTRERALVIGVLALVAIGAAVDIVLDAPSPWLTVHILLELGLAALSLGVIAYLALRWRRTSYALATVRSRLVERQAERDAWQRRAQTAVAGLTVAIDDQLKDWQLTPAEREVAFGLLKGLSHKRIAALSGRSERTVRQHAIAVYQKAGVSGRAELAACFLGELGRPAVSPPADAPPLRSR